MKKVSIGIVGPSSVIPQVELRLGVQTLQKLGFQVSVHAQCRKAHLFFAGSDLERAQAFCEVAASTESSVLWCARGGHGSIRLLPLIEEWTKKNGIPPKKLLVGYSDSTALMEYVRVNWGWSILHGPMPSMRTFSILPQSDLHALKVWIEGRSTVETGSERSSRNWPEPWKGKSLTFWTAPPKASLLAPLVGGNLTVWNCLVGSRFQGQAKESLLFFEDIGEALYRIDRTLQQLSLSGAFDGIRGIVLGNFLNCNEAVPSVLKKMPESKGRSRILNSPKPNELKPLRKILDPEKGLRAMFSELGTQLKIPVAFGLPVGHGPEVSPLPLGAQYRLTPKGRFELVEWDWLG